MKEYSVLRNFYYKSNIKHILLYYIEFWFGIMLGLFIYLIDKQIDNPNMTKIIDSSLIISVAILGVLITHKSILLTSAKNNTLYNEIINTNNKNSKILYNQFNLSLNIPIYISFILIMYTMICIIDSKIFFKSIIIIPLIFSLIVSVLKFMFYFNKLFNEYK